MAPFGLFVPLTPKEEVSHKPNHLNNELQFLFEGTKEGEPMPEMNLMFCNLLLSTHYIPTGRMSHQTKKLPEDFLKKFKKLST